MSTPQAWLATRGWKPFAFQREVWRAMAGGASGLLHARTGAGKTYAVWLGALARARPRAGRVDPPGLRVLWITPMRALATDTARALAEVVSGDAPMLAGVEVGQRTGDTGETERARQARRLPFALVTTPESVSLMLARADARERLGGIDTVIVDEWHELMGSKRGVQTQLALARLARWNPGLIVWGLSATLGNLERALGVLCAPVLARPCAGRPAPRLVRARASGRLVVDTLLPASTERFPWGGHLGIRMLDPVVAELEASATSLVFCNTRSQAELWYQAVIARRPDWSGIVALHHGSLARGVRDWVEQGLRDARLKAVVCTSSLDLGVDFSPVERVLQVGSAKGVARLLQRAGRSGHGPGRTSRVTLVPTNALELIEAAAVRDAIAAGRIESRAAPVAPLDVLVQHLVTIAAGGGFRPDELLAEVRGTDAFASLGDEAFAWAVDFVVRGGTSLAAYPEYRRVLAGDDGVLRVADPAIARRHRMSIGTIVADAAVVVRYIGGSSIGTIEESFIARLRKGQCFLFGGRVLELVRVHEMTAYVRRAGAARAAVPRWGGGRMPLSSELAGASLARLGEAAQGRFAGPEMRLVAPLLRLQAQWSALPRPDAFVVESLRSREGHHLFAYPFAGRHAHIGLAALFAWRAGQAGGASFSIAVNDYGFELLASDPVDWSGLRDGSLLADGNLLEQLLASLNASELAQRRFREIARIAGLVFQGYPGAQRSTRQLQASSGLFFEVFRRHDAGNQLLAQAEREVFEQELEVDRLRATLARLRACAPARCIGSTRRGPRPSHSR